MSDSKILVILLVAVAVLLAASAPVSAQTSSTGNYVFKVGLMGGAGGSIDEDKPGYGNSAFQLHGSVVLESNSQVGLRIGSLDLGSDQPLGDLFDAGLTYLTVAGEYTFGEMGYVSSLFAGIGVYELEGTHQLTGAAVSNTRVGLTLGATGEFNISKSFGVVGELSAHALPSGEAQFFASGMVGLAYYFK